VHTDEGEQRIEQMIADDIAEARDAGDARRAAELKLVLRHFAETHAHPGA
jgi:hypothetical protein